MKRLIVLLGVLAVPCSAAAAEGGRVQGQTPPDAASAVRAPSDDGSAGITREQANGILRELRAIRQILERQRQQPAAARGQVPSNVQPQRVTISIPPAAALTALGRKDAPITIVEFIDFECSYCQRHDSGTLATLKEKYIETGKVRYVSRDLPLDMHANAGSAARAARCAATQGKYWDLRRVMFANMRSLSPSDLAGHARTAGLEMLAFETCMQDKAADTTMRAEAAEVTALGITGTPSFVIGRTIAAGLEGKLIVGAQPFPSFEARIAELQDGTAAVDSPK